MDLSSLVFVAIIGVWVAYLVPHWLRRRSELADSRVPDRFSGGLRVLQRRVRSARVAHRSGEPVLTSPRLVVDADGEYLYIAGDRTVEARLATGVASVGVALEDVDRAPVAAAPHDEPVVADEAIGTAHEPLEADMPEGPSDLELAIGSARVAARRRALIMLSLVLAVVVSWALVLGGGRGALWAAAPASLLLVMHGLASRAAGLRSRQGLMALAVQVRSSEIIRARPQRVVVPAAPVAPAAPVPDRVAARAAAVGASTWQPVPVPPPTYTLKPAVHRPEPAPLDLPAAAASAATGGSVSRGALPRRPADIERILALESPIDELFEEPKVVNG